MVCLAKNRPKDVTAIAIFTLVFTAVILSGFGMLEARFIYSGAIEVIVFLETYALVISSLMLLFNSKYVWYGSVAFWVLLIMTSLAY